MLQQCPHCRRVVSVRDDGRCSACGGDLSAKADAAAGPMIHVDPRAISDRARRAAAEEGDPFTHSPPMTAYTGANFYQRLMEATPRVFITYVLIAANVIVFFAMFTTGDNPFTPTIDGLIRWGGNFGPLTLGGEWWRLFTCMFLHAGLLHIGFNMWVLYDIGQLVERMLGNIGFLLLYVVSGLFGSLASLWWSGGDRVSVGASGAVFGCFGMLLGFLLVQRRSLPPGMFQQLFRSGLTFVGYNVVFGLMIPGIDNAAHFGGLAAGFVGGLILSQNLEGNVAFGRAWRNVAMLAVAGGGIAAAVYFLPPPPFNWMGGPQKLAELERQAVELSNELAEQSRGGKLTDEAYANRVEQEVIPLWKEASELADKMGDSPGFNKPVFAKFRESISLRARAAEAFVEGVRQNDDAKMQEHHRLLEQANTLIEQLNQENN